MTQKVLVTPRSLTEAPHPAVEAMARTGVEPVSREVIEAAKNLRVVSRNGTGLDNLPLIDRAVLDIVKPGLASRPDVIASLHIGGYTKESVNRATEVAVHNLLESPGVKQPALTE